MWFELTGYERIRNRCASDGCGGQPTWRLEAGGIASEYCSGCKAKIDEPVMRAVPEAVLTEMMSAAWDMAEEFEAELDARYQSRNEQPVQQRRYDRDMDAVHKFRAAYEKLVF